MSMPEDLGRLINAVEVLTGTWLSGDVAERLLASCSTREEVFAHGMINYGWLAKAPGALPLFQAVVEAAAIPPAPLGVMPLPSQQKFQAERQLGRVEAECLAKQFAESPVASDPLMVLTTLGSESSESD